MTVLNINHMGIVLSDTLATDIYCLVLFQISPQKIRVIRARGNVLAENVQKYLHWDRCFKIFSKTT